MNLLLECARAHLDAGAIRSAVEREIDWDATLDCADRHGMRPLLYWCLNQTCPEAVPPPVLDTLRISTHACARRSLRYTAELFRILDVFAASGIPVVPFKGPAIAWSLYQSPALREMGDLDLLVAPAHVASAKASLLALGYQPQSPADDPRFYGYVSQMHFVRQDDIEADLHWRLGPVYFHAWSDAGPVWARLAPVEMGRRTVMTLGGEDLLRFLCLHAAKHGWVSLGGLCDIARLLASCAIDWDRTLGDAHAMGGSRTLFLGLALAHDLAGASLPQTVERSIAADPSVERLAATAKARLLPAAPDDIGAGDLLRWQWKLLEHPAGKFRLCLGLMRPSSLDWESFRLPRPLWPLYYFLKPFRLTAKYGIPAARRLFS